MSTCKASSANLVVTSYTTRVKVLKKAARRSGVFQQIRPNSLQNGLACYGAKKFSNMLSEFERHGSDRVREQEHEEEVDGFEGTLERYD